MDTAKKQSWGGYAGAVALIVVLALAIGRRDQGPVPFCGRVFRGLVDGNRSVEGAIAWERLQAMGVDVGATYTGLANEKERAEYRRAFIQSFGSGFTQGGGEASAFKGWRVDAEEGDRILVAVDYEGRERTLVFGLPASGERMVETIHWLNAD